MSISTTLLSISTTLNSISTTKILVVKSLSRLKIIIVNIDLSHYGGLGSKNGKITPLFVDLLTTAFRGHLVW